MKSYDELEKHAEALREFLDNETKLGMRGDGDCLHHTRQAMRYFGNRERSAGLARLERARTAHSHCVAVRSAVDDLVFARQREWRRWIGIDRLKLRDLIVDATTATVAQLEREVAALRMWISRDLHCANDPDLTGCYREIDEAEVAP